MLIWLDFTISTSYRVRNDEVGFCTKKSKDIVYVLMSRNYNIVADYVLELPLNEAI